MADRITVLLVDDHSLVRSGFRRILEDDPGILVVGEASDGREAVELAIRLRPQVVVMDYALPGMDGALATRRILAALPETAILLLSMHSEESYVRNSLEAGARGYLLKNAVDLELVKAVQDVAAGRQVLDSRLPSAAKSVSEKKPRLTAREREVLQLIVEGRPNKEIATVLDLSVNTVAVHRANIMEALEIHNTAELVVYAIRHGLVTLP
jgi:DNA-binding NarL/FixJ family response regulator